MREKRDLAELRHGYTWKVRTLEISSIVTYGVMMVALGLRLWPEGRTQVWLMVAALFTGFLAADFISGFVHWAADTWGSISMPWIGNALIRPFREHHVDQKEITRHDFVETNGNNCLISIPTIAICLWMPIHHWLGLFVSASLGSMVLWVMATNQFHKWSHLDEPKGLIAWLQRLHLILPPEHHAVHHAAPHTDYYCITVGWLNPPLKWVGFFRISERLVTLCTGLLPRADDLGADEAKRVLAEHDDVQPSPAATRGSTG
jgi:ubiquitin-conjugating enzyme E2 variant